MHSKDQPPQTHQAQGILVDALHASCDGAWASHEEIALVAQSGISALPEADRDRVLRAIVSNADGASAVFELAEISEDAATQLGDNRTGSAQWQSQQQKQNQGGFHLFSQIAMPAWGLAASVMLVSGVGLLMESGTGQQPKDTFVPGGMPSGTPGATHASQGQPHETQAGSLEADGGVGLSLMIPVFLVALICTIALTPVIWRRSRGSTR